MRAGRLMHVSSGFTLIELSLSIAFISVLSIIIVVLINGTISSYNRGLTLNKINTGGMDLVDELRTVMQGSRDGSVLDECKRYDIEGSSAKTAFDNCEKDGAKMFVSVVRRDNNIPIYGAFCTGRYSYIWNSGYFSNNENGIISGDLPPATLMYKTGSSTDAKLYTPSGGEGGGYIRLIKIEDERRAVCAAKIKKDSYEADWSNNIFDISSNSLNSEPEEILSSDGRNELAIYYLDTAKPAESKDKKDVFYLVSMVLGTANGGVDLSKNSDFCATPDEAFGNIDFCAVNKFNFAVQVNGL